MKDKYRQVCITLREDQIERIKKLKEDGEFGLSKFIREKIDEYIELMDTIEMEIKEQLGDNGKETA